MPRPNGRKRGGVPDSSRSISRISDMDRARRMYELRLKGVSLMAIATTFKCTPAAVHGILDKYTRQELLPYVEDYRTMQMERLDFLWHKLVASGRLEKGDPAAFNAGVNILRRYAETTGSDAPTKIELGLKVDPKEIELRQLILDAQRQAKGEIAAIRGSVEPDDDEDEDSTSD